MRVLTKVCFFVLSVFVFQTALAQVKTDTLTASQTDSLHKKLEKELYKSQKKNVFRVFPTVYYTPETKFAFGAAALYSFRFNSQDTNLPYSRVLPSIIYTLNKQFFVASMFELYFTPKWVVSGRVGFYIYPYFFSGIGNDIDIHYEEWYDAEYPLLRLNLYRTILDSPFSVGVNFRFQNTTIRSVSDSGLLDVADAPGAKGSAQAAMGFGAKYDSRNYLLSPTKGWYTKVEGVWSNADFGSTYNDQFIIVDIRKYFQVFKKKDVLAFQLYSEIHNGDVPFNLMAQLGGQNRMRGYREGVYRDKQMMVYQAEYRSRMFYKYFGFALFASVGGIGSDFQDVNANYRYAYGGGLRISVMPEKRVFMRIDYGVGKETYGIYFSLGEAF